MPLLLFLLGAACGWAAMRLTPATPELRMPAVTGRPCECGCRGYVTIDRIGAGAEGRTWPTGLSASIES